jgi:hypothetical protein
VQKAPYLNKSFRKCHSDINTLYDLILTSLASNDTEVWPMHKEELIQLHTLLVRVKNYFEEHTFCSGEFERYNSLHIGPMHIHRSKAEHKHAIFVLGNELASVMDSEELSGTGRISARMQELAARTEMIRLR